MTPAAHVRSLALILGLVLVAPAARADLFSPGELAAPHAELEGLKNCTQCHEAGERLAQQRCLDCHKELAPQVANGRGFHGRIAAADRSCERCHKDHLGREHPLIDWEGGKKRFDHARTGWPLKGAHASADCEKCHERRRVADEAVLALLKKSPKRASYLGLPQECKSCHFDEHRGQLGLECQSCHDEKKFKPAPGFDHKKSRFALVGKHQTVACEKCHPNVEDEPRDVFPAPKAASYARYRGLQFKTCLDCHKDPHENKFGQDCKRCHTPNSWTTVTDLGKERGFHQKTRYPLEGAHVGVACVACHGPFPGVKAKFKGLAFDDCFDCHADAHLGQFAAKPPLPPGPGGTRKQGERRADSGSPDCKRCHTVEGFVPPRFELEDHQKTQFTLEGAHRAVACARCHPRDDKLAGRIPQKTAAQLKSRKRPQRFSLVRFDVPNASRCETCHDDPHAGQFAQRKGGCIECHGTPTAGGAVQVGLSFAELRFDHDRDSRYRLEGKHRQAACAGCHPAERVNGKRAVRYRPLETACAACHADEHLGQLALEPGKPTDCARCHTTEDYKKTRFEHQPPFTAYKLEGKHRDVACEKCHPAVALAEGAKAKRRYKPMPTACESCHADHHRGAFRGFTP